MKIFVTGHNGFIGSHLVNALRNAGHDVSHSESRLDLTNTDLLAKNFFGNQVVFHCAGYAHANDDGTEAFAAAHWQINFQCAVNVAEAAIATGVNRLVFLSSAKAVADAPGIIINESFTQLPVSAYGKAKRAAEDALLALAGKSDIDVVILRPVMVYGHNSGGNLPRILKAIRQGWFPPLPEGGRRSLVQIDDLLAALLLAGTHPAAAGKIYIVAHPRPVTTRQICHLFYKMLGRSVPTWSMPEMLLRVIAFAGDIAGHLAGKPMPFNGMVYAKLMQPAVYSAEKISSELGWSPCVDLQEGIESLRPFLANKNPV